MERNSLKGVFAPVVTPFQDDELRLDWLEENLSRLVKTDLGGFLALGSNGEFKSLGDAEKLEIVKTFVKLKGEKALMVGTGCESTRETIDLTNRMADAGADFASILPPHYFASRMDEKRIISHYREVAENSRIPVLLYNIPRLASGVSISTGAARVLSSHPNIRGIKDSGGASVFSFLAVLPGDFCVLAGSAAYFLPAVLLGAAGGIISLANVFPEICCELYALGITGNPDAALELHGRILQANSAVSGKAGVAGVKAAMDLAGYRGGAPRRPLEPLAEEEREAMRTRLKELGLLS